MGKRQQKPGKNRRRSDKARGSQRIRRRISRELSRLSHSEKLNCVVRKVNQDNKKKQFIEIWSGKGLHKNFDVAAFDVHGEIYSDGEFGSLCWSPDEEAVAYVAEKKSKKGEPFYKQKPPSANSGEEKTGEEYMFKQDWGEQLVGKHRTVIGICELKTETLRVVNGIPSYLCPGQVIWGLDDKIYGVAYDTRPRQLGLVHCTNRPGVIFQVSAKGGDFKVISDPKRAPRSPRLSPDGKQLYWLQRPTGNLHNGCLELAKADLSGPKFPKLVLIHIVQSTGKGFPGLFLHSLPQRCFSNDGSKVFFTSCNKIRNSAYYLDTKTREVSPLETGSGSATVLDVHNDLILISSGNMQQSPALRITKVLPAYTGKIDWIVVVKSENICKEAVLKELEFESKPPEQKFLYYNALYYGPPATKDTRVPLILYPHGGPHASTVNDYAFEPNFFVKAGFAVLMVNYRGSTGVGQVGIDFLPGKIGDTDVKDNHDAVLHILKTYPHLNDRNIFIYGKSHGGYLASRMSAMYPDFYRAIAAGNPVIDIPGMYLSSDIPDWATSECGVSFDESKPITPENLNKLVVASASFLCDKIKAPTLFLIGKNDLRVPCHQGIKMYYSLKSKQLKTRLNLYDDNHSLASVPTHIDSLINVVLWFTDHHSSEEKDDQ